MSTKISFAFSRLSCYQYLVLFLLQYGLALKGSLGGPIHTKKVTMQLLANMEEFISLHQNPPPVYNMKVEVDGTQHRIVGRCTTIEDLSITMVQLLSRESTPQCMKESQTAREELQVAANMLVNDGRTFQTTLSPYWNVPAIVWMLED